MFKHVLLFSIEKSQLSQLSFNEFSKVSNLSLFARLIPNLKSKCNVSLLAKKIMRWFDESKGNANPLTIGLLGFLHNFMYMISAIDKNDD